MSERIIYLAGCLIQNKAGKILLMHRDNGKRNQWETPGGKVDEGETPEQAAIRELKEELGVGVKITRKVGETDFIEDDRALHYTWFQAEIVSGSPTIQEPQTFTEFKYFSWLEMEQMFDKLSSNAKNLARSFQEKQITV